MNLDSNIVSVPIPSEILWMFVAFAIIFFLIMSFIFRHHWNYYGIEGNQKVFAKALFIIISIFLILSMTASVLFFEIL